MCLPNKLNATESDSLVVTTSGLPKLCDLAKVDDGGGAGALIGKGGVAEPLEEAFSSTGLLSL